MTWGEKEHQKFTEEVQTIQKDLGAIIKKIQVEKEAKLAPLQEEYLKLLDGILKRIILSENISLILTKQAAIHAHPTADITAKVTAELDKAVAAQTSDKK